MGEFFQGTNQVSSVESHNAYFRKRLWEEREEAKKRETKCVKDVSIEWDDSDVYNAVAIYRIPKKQQNWYAGKLCLCHPRTNWKTLSCDVSSSVKDGLLKMIIRGQVSPTSIRYGFELHVEFNSFSYYRMELALVAMSDSKICKQLLEPLIEAPRLVDEEVDIKLAPNMPVPNDSQIAAIRLALREGVHLIQGPPGYFCDCTKQLLLLRLST